MTSALYLWAAGERAEMSNDLRWFNAGAKLFSPSGDDITTMKVSQLNSRIKELDRILGEHEKP